MSQIGLPGLSRVFRITEVDVDGKRVRLGGVVEDRSRLLRGESPNVELVVAPGRKIVRVPFVGRPSELSIA
jgi:cytochrome c-type biogenesis protein CcmE